MNPEIKYHIQNTILKHLLDKQESQLNKDEIRSDREFRVLLGIHQCYALEFYEQICLLRSRKYIKKNALDSGKVYYSLTVRGVDSIQTSQWLKRISEAGKYIDWDYDDFKVVLVPKLSYNCFEIKTEEKLIIKLYSGKIMLVMNGKNGRQSKTLINASENKHIEYLEGFETFHFITQETKYITYQLI
jgi:hypothetical protein